MHLKFKASDLKEVQVISTHIHIELKAIGLVEYTYIVQALNEIHKEKSELKGKKVYVEKFDAKFIPGVHANFGALQKSV